MKSRFNGGGVEVGPVTDWCHYKFLEPSALNGAGFAPMFPSLIALLSTGVAFLLAVCIKTQGAAFFLIFFFSNCSSLFSTFTQ